MTPDRAAALRSQGHAFAAARHRAGFTQATAAAVLGVPVNTLQKWEQGKKSIPLSVRRRAVEEWGADARALALDETRRACPCCGRDY